MPRFRRRSIACITLASVWLAIAAGRLVASDTLRTVALTGAHVPGETADATYRGFVSASPYTLPAINNNGQVAFQAIFTDAGQSLGAMMSEGGGAGPRVIARAPTAIHADAGSINKFFVPHISDQGQTVFVASVDASAIIPPTLAIFRDDGAGQLSQIAEPGTPAPGLDPAITFANLFANGNPWAALASGDDGQLAFLSRLNNPGNFSDSGIWKGDDHGVLAQFVRTGDPAPGTTGNFGDIVAHSGGMVLMNHLGQVAFSNSSDDGSIGIWAEHADGLKFDVRSGQPAPGFPGASLNFTSNPLLGFNSQGQILFRATISGPGFPARDSLWRNDSSGPSLIVRAGGAAPGIPDGVFYSSQLSSAMNARGDVAFSGFAEAPSVNPTNFYSGLWSDAGGHGLSAVAISGDPAPGTEPGVVFDSLSVSTPFDLNARGQLAFLGSLQGLGIDNSNNRGIWAQDANGDLALVARLGGQLNVSDNLASPDWRTVSVLRAFGNPNGLGKMPGNDDGKPSWFNDRGQLTFWAKFSDGSEGLFVSNLVAVPEPSTLVLLFAGITTICSRRCQKGCKLVIT
jgi:hypothetical protein